MGRSKKGHSPYLPYLPYYYKGRIVGALTLALTFMGLGRMGLFLHQFLVVPPSRKNGALRRMGLGRAGSLYQKNGVGLPYLITLPSCMRVGPSFLHSGKRL